MLMEFMLYCTPIWIDTHGYEWNDYGLDTGIQCKLLTPYPK